MLSCLTLCNLSDGLIQSVQIVEIPVWHIEQAEVNVLFVPRLKFRPYYFTICGQMWLCISAKAILGRSKYASTLSNRSVIPMNCVLKREEFAGFKAFLTGSCPGLILFSHGSVPQARAGLI